MVDRISALAGANAGGRFDVDGEIGVTLQEIPDLSLTQVAAWPDALAAVASRIAEQVGAGSVPGPGMSASGTAGTILRVEPLKFWLVTAPPPHLTPDQGAILDLSHSRTHIRISGPQATTLLNRHLPLDLRENIFRAGAVASSALEHVGVTVWRSENGYDLFLPRGYALSVWDLLLQGAAQFGYEVLAV